MELKQEIKEIKEILEILRIVRHEFMSQCKEGLNTGFCSAVYDCEDKGLLTREEGQKFDKYLRRSKRNQKWYYKECGQKTELKSQFMWLTEDLDARFDWIDKHILKHE